MSKIGGRCLGGIRVTCIKFGAEFGILEVYEFVFLRGWGCGVVRSSGRGAVLILLDKCDDRIGIWGFRVSC